ncbi:MAG: methionyl-tRNA formyltransferase [Planctomycetota bacterium]|nr:methionyl-tRNA formyltransferase [Planctomycetota bacterium]
MKVVFVGSGAFGVPTLRALAEASSHELVGVLTKPGRPAGRGQKIRQTPVFEAATEYGLDLAAPNSINDDSGQEWLDHKSPDALVVIAYERLLTKRVLSGRFACNLHASLLPRWRGAAPIHRAVLAGDQDIGVSVIELASSMDTGAVYARKSVPRDPLLTTGEWHDRMADWGPELITETLNAFASGNLAPIPQDSQSATHAKKLSKSEGVFDPQLSSRLALAQIHGLEPWPRCSALIGGVRVQLRRAKMAQSGPECAGLVDEFGQLRCHDGWIQVTKVQPESRKSMSFTDFARGLACAWPQPVQGV